VIASDLDGIPEAFAVANYGELVKAGEVTQLANAMARWAGKPRLSMAERRQLHTKVSARFSLQRAAQDLCALYESLLDHPAPIMTGGFLEDAAELLLQP